MSTAEIAGVLGRSEGAVRVLIHRAPAAPWRADLGTARGTRADDGRRTAGPTIGPRSRRWSPTATSSPLLAAAERRRRRAGRPDARPDTRRAVARAAPRPRRGSIRRSGSRSGWPPGSPTFADASDARPRWSSRSPARSGADAGADPRDPLLPAILAGALDPADGRRPRHRRPPAGARRPLLVGGAITSAAISLVGVAWRGLAPAHPSPRPGRATSPGPRAAGAGST